MRRVRHLAAATLTAAALSLAAPAVAFADTVPGVPSDRPMSSSPQDDYKKTDDYKKADDKKADDKSWGKDKKTDGDHGWTGTKDKDSDSKDPSSKDKDRRPHGGVHTGGGFAALNSGSAATGAALLAGGVGVGALALRRRKPAER
ncbi:hypothetical protein [Kitasatospora sp. GAS204B]|uniref:hypothetical protein n=1 Tax=unclassified Kitasatospora TaxID=2633591 RepID=UPI00247522B6|nr:hypothetical protein [Kitasatospora sp. GAS204B]MDH6117535.1 hypothetical protein [Kitasatospora sp. GAS204B]